MAPPQAAEIPKAYSPKGVEEHICRFRMDRGLFTPPADSGKPPFVIVVPSPNVTGKLHLGHAITAAIEDALVQEFAA